MNKLNTWLIVALMIISGPGLIFAQTISEEEINDAYSRSFTHEKIGNYNDAVKSLAMVYKSYPDGYSINLRLGYLNYLKGAYANALAYYEKAMSVSQYALDPKLGYSLILVLQNKFEKAETIAYQIVNIDYYNYYGNLRLAYILRKEKKYDLASQIILKMLTLYPIDISYLTEYAIIKYETEDYKTSKQLFRDVLTLDPENVTSKEFLDLIAAKTAKKSK